jgi:hypothetical protein
MKKVLLYSLLLVRGLIASQVLAGTGATGIKLAKLFCPAFIVFGMMIILNLFIGIILNSMAKTHAEIARGTGPAAANELGALEEQLRSMQATVQGLRRDRQNLRGDH